MELTPAVIGEREFRAVQEFLSGEAGIHLSNAKRYLVAGRLATRLRHYGMSNFVDYIRLVEQGESPEERQIMLDLLTTHETYFFREPRHFEFLEQGILAGLPSRPPYRVWSAACSTGEEPYTLAMLLDSRLGSSGWTLLASDISKTVLEQARQGLYPLKDTARIPSRLFNRYCTTQAGLKQECFMIIPALREQIEFRRINLNGPWPAVGQFDLIFLRNAMIYFDGETKQRLMARLFAILRPGGHLVVGLSESLQAVAQGIRMITPSIYRKEGG